MFVQAKFCLIKFSDLLTGTQSSNFGTWNMKNWDPRIGTRNSKLGTRIGKSLGPKTTKLGPDSILSLFILWISKINIKIIEYFMVEKFVFNETNFLLFTLFYFFSSLLQIDKFTVNFWTNFIRVLCYFMLLLNCLFYEIFSKKLYVVWRVENIFENPRDELFKHRRIGVIQKWRNGKNSLFLRNFPEIVRHVTDLDLWPPS